MTIHHPIQHFSKKSHGFVPLILFISGCLFLTGCSMTSETFDTQAVEGVGAKSITKVNAMVNQGEIGGLNQESSSKFMQPIFSTFDAKSLNPEHVTLLHKTITYRQPEKHHRVWIAPFQDAQGDLHEAFFIHTLLGRGYWQLGNNPFYSYS
jgi:conjugal transfer pilus assembly protein TraV